MIELRDKDKNRVAGLVDYENLCIESVLDSGDKTLSFYYPKKGKYYDEIVEEAYIRTKKDEFVVKAREIDDDYSKFECSLNLEELEGNIFDRFESIEQTITLALNLAIAGTWWIVKDNTLKKRRTVRCTNKSSLEIVREIKKVYRVDIVFNTLRKQIEVYEHLGEDKGTYFIDSLNLIALQIQSDSRQYATRIIAEGKDGLSFSDINNGKNYVENYQYSNKIKTIYWKDERYSVKENLLDDARAKLEELSKPFRSYSARILNLAELNPKYKNILDYSLGDTITLLSKSNKLRDKQRIVKTVEYPQDHSRDTVELANAILKFEDIQQENQETTDTVNNITTDNGTVDGSTIDSITTKQIEDFEANVIKVAKLKAILAEIENLHVNKADIQNLNAVIARIGTLEATKASITELNAIHAIIQQIKAGKADIADLNAAVAKVGILENKTAVLENALAGNLTADNFKTNAITAGSAVIAEGAIGSSQISSLSVNKLEAGDITTSKHKIVSADGTIEIVGNQILINRNNVNRVILGEYRKSDGTTEYGLLVRAKDGQTIMLDGNGVHNAGITDGAIDNNKVADNANISGNKLDINSVIREVNTHGTETIKGTKVQIGDRTLDVELSTQKNTITEHSKELSSQKASLTALDNALKFKVDSQTFTQSTETINSNINRAKEEAINSANSNTTNAINNLDIGNENLLDDSERERTNYPNKQGEYLSVPITDIIKSNLGKQIVLSGEIKSLGNDGSINIYSLGKYEFNNSKSVKCTTKEFIPFELVITPTYNPNGYNGEVCNWSFYGIYGSGIYPCVRKLKVALGNKKSSWSPSENDLKKYSDEVAKAKADLAQANAIANADGKITEEERKRIQQAQENLNKAISKADKAKQDAILEANRVAELKKQEAISSANSHADSKANEALSNAKAFVNAEITTVNSHLNKATAEINVLKEKIESKVSQVDIDKSINKVVIGGRNLVINREDFKFTSSNYGGTDISKKGIIEINNPSRRFRVGGYLQRYLSEKLDNSKPYCISLDLKANGESKNLYLSFYYRGANSSLYAEGVRVSDINNIWRRFTIKMHPNENSNTDVLELVFNSMSRDCGVTRIEYRNLKIEEGTIPTADSEAPEDSKNLIVDSIKVVTDKISTVESIFTQENNNIKASVQNLNSTTQTITTNVSNINRNLTSRINSNLDVAKNFATSKATEALNNAKAFVNAEITTVNTKVHNLESNITILTDRINSKVSQSDIDRSITTVDNKIKIVDSKISDVSSSVTQLRDSVTTDIRAINSKTHSIETNLNGKATKQEVTEVNNRVTIIKASLDGITQRISATESKTQTLETNLNGKASKQEVNNVSSKVVSLEANLNGITNRVSSTESRINTLNGQVANATTRQEFTEFKQSTNDFKWKVEQGLGGNNLIKNSGFLNGYSQFFVTEYQWNGVNSSVNVWGDSSEWVMTGTNALVIRGTNGSHGAYGVRQENIKLKPNTTYTLSGYAAVHRGEWRISLAQNDWGWIASSRGNKSGGKNPDNWNRFEITFKTGPAHDYLTNCKLDLMLENAHNDAYAWFTNLVLNEGSIADKWQQFNNELYTSDMSFDTNGLYCSFSDGSHSSMSKDGFEWFNAGTGHSYHALAYVTSFGIPAGNPGRAYVRLPVEFTKRRKSLKWTVALRGYYYSTSGDFFPMHVHASGTEEYEENGILVCPIEGYCKIQNAQNSGDIQFRPVTAMLIAVA